MSEFTYEPKGFDKMVENIEGRCGLIYYVADHVREYESLEDCREALLIAIKTANAYDPMQLHGVKTEKEMEDMVDEKYRMLYKRDEEADIDVRTLSIDKSGDVMKAKADTEALEGFRSWM